MQFQRLPNSVTVQYSELMQQSVQPISDGSNLSFTPKTINGKRYWYLRINVGQTRREHYLGEESTELLDQIDDEKAAWESNVNDRDLRARLVNMLLGGGMVGVTHDEGTVIALIERSGAFLAGGSLVGTLAFRLYANMLGVVWGDSVGTQDVDVALDYAVALPRENRESLRHLILDSGLGFVEVPAFNRRHPSTSFKIRGRDFLVDILTPMRGRETERPVPLDAFDTYATPLRHLDYLLEDLQPAIALHKHGLMVNVPAPGRFAVHKCAISQKRGTSAAGKASKDLRQAEQVFAALLELRPVDIADALTACDTRAEFAKQFETGLAQIDKSIASEVMKLR